MAAAIDSAIAVGAAVILGAFAGAAGWVGVVAADSTIGNAASES